MKRLLALLALCLLLAAPVVATNYNFAEPSDYFRLTNYTTNLTCPSLATVQWVINTTSPSQNGYPYFVGATLPGACSEGSVAYLRLNNPYPTEYSAVTRLYSDITSFVRITAFLFSADMTPIDTHYFTSDVPLNQRMRYEVKMLGGYPQYWKNGELEYTGPLLSGNPAFIAWGHMQASGGTSHEVALDDYNFAEPNRMQMTLPGNDNNTLILLKDIVNPASSGIAFGENGTVVDSNYMYGGWSRGNASTDSPLDTQPNWTIQLKNYNTGVVYATNYTGLSGSSGQKAFTDNLAWNVRDLIIENTTAPQGYYGLYCPETLDWSNTILYKSNGANVQWDSDSYSHGDDASVIYYVLSGGYWDTSTYSYKIAILDSYMNFKANTSLTSSTGTVTHSWEDGDTEGVYHAWLIATSNVGANEYIIGDDYTNLVAYFGYGGYANDGYTGLPLSDVAINITQGTSISNQSSGSDGNYTSQKLFVTGASVFFNVTKPGYNPYQYNFVPLASKSVYDLNVTIYPSAPDGSTGVKVGGVIRDIIYGRPIPGATVYLFNQTTAEQNSQTTNVAGGYICEPETVCTLIPNQQYYVNATKLGYNQSVDYSVVAAGEL